MGCNGIAWNKEPLPYFSYTGRVVLTVKKFEERIVTEKNRVKNCKDRALWVESKQTTDHLAAEILIYRGMAIVGASIFPVRRQIASLEKMIV